MGGGGGGGGGGRGGGGGGEGGGGGDMPRRVTNVSQLIERARQIRGTLRNWGGAQHDSPRCVDSLSLSLSLSVRAHVCVRVFVCV